MAFKLRWYQEDSVRMLLNYDFNTNPLIALPTGTGKSVVIAEFIKRAFNMYPTTRIMMLTHVKELVQQNADKLRGVWETAPLGIFSAGLRRKDVGYPITFGNMQSVWKFISKQLEHKQPHFGRIDLLIVDEAHLISDNEETTYRSLIKALFDVNPYIKVIGLTATPYRTKSGMLTDSGIFGEIIYDLTSPSNFIQLINDGFLSPLIPKRTSVQVDVSNVSLLAGEFNASELADVVDKDEITFNAVREIVETGTLQGRKSWIVFGTSVEHCEHIQGMFSSFGIPSATVHSKKKPIENDNNIQAFKRGEITCLINNNKLTTGFDHPDIDLIGMLRPTNSVGLWVQMLGRGTRVAPMKENCLVLDFAGNTERLGCINDPNIPDRKKKGKGAIGVAPVKVCPECSCYNHARASVCSVCGAEFVMNLNLFTEASSLELIKEVKPPMIEQFPVKNIAYNAYTKNGSVPTLQVTYYCDELGVSRFKEFVCFEHSGLPRVLAKQWWSQRTSEEVPSTVFEAISKQHLLKVPKNISVRTDTKYPEIVAVGF